MIRKRIPQQDDRTIYELACSLLLPFARETFPELKLTPALLRSRLEGCDTYVEAGAGRRPVGFITLRREREDLTIEMLAVDARQQGRGTGTRLMQFAERRALKAGIRDIQLWVDEGNERAQRFYAGHGYAAIHYDQRLRCYRMYKRL